MDFHPPAKSGGGGTSWGATLGAGGRGVMRAAAGGKLLHNFFMNESLGQAHYFVYTRAKLCFEF